MEEEAGLKLVPRTGPCLVRGELEKTSRWEICPQASDGCEYAKDQKFFNRYCSNPERHYDCEEERDDIKFAEESLREFFKSMVEPILVKMERNTINDY